MKRTTYIIIALALCIATSCSTKSDYEIEKEEFVAEQTELAKERQELAEEEAQLCQEYEELRQAILRLFFENLLTAPRSQVFNPLKI